MDENSLVGKTVKLKSGGAVMTVREIETVDEIETATCEWMVEGKLESKPFPISMLVEAVPPTPRPRFKLIRRS